LVMIRADQINHHHQLNQRSVLLLSELRYFASLRETRQFENNLLPPVI
jgi:hypothetical protein